MSVVHARLNPTLADTSNAGRLKVQQERRCRICGSELSLTRHHLVPHAWFLQRRLELRVLRNANANIVPLCEFCHQIVDGREPVPRLQRRAMLRTRLYPNEMAFILQIMGRDWLDAHYPIHP